LTDNIIHHNFPIITKKKNLTTAISGLRWLSKQSTKTVPIAQEKYEIINFIFSSLLSDFS